MAQKTWPVELEDGTHVVELEHGYWSGKRTIRHNGETILRASKAFDTGDDFVFPLGAHTGAVRITTNGLTYSYDLFVDGRSVATGQEEMRLARPVVVAGRAAPEPLTAEYLAGELRGRAVALIGAGLVSIALFRFLDPVWGGLLVAAGLAVLLVQRREMFLLSGAVLVLAGVMNVNFTNPIGVSVFGGLQVLWGVMELRDFRRYSGVGRAIGNVPGQPGSS